MTIRMMQSWIALAGAGVLLAACAYDPHPNPNPVALGSAAGGANHCAQHGGCGNSYPAHQQYYDEHAHRYYYYDGAAGRYDWEDGAPRN